MTPVLQIRDLQVSYWQRQAGRRSSVTVIDKLDLDVYPGEVLGVVGESGSGKSTLASAIVGLVDDVEGSIQLNGQELLGLTGKARKPIQRQLQMVFQNPQLSLSPRRPVGVQLAEPLRIHTGLDSSDRDNRIDTVLGQLELSSAVKDRFPHELSGGQAQRVALARALVLEPSVIVFDEPTSALDVSVQAGVLNLLKEIREMHQLTYIFITHDLGVARHLANRIAVMRQGEIVELRDTEDLYTDPNHDYTRTLLQSSLTI